MITTTNLMEIIFHFRLEFISSYIYLSYLLFALVFFFCFVDVFRFQSLWSFNFFFIVVLYINIWRRVTIFMFRMLDSYTYLFCWLYFGLFNCFHVMQFFFVLKKLRTMPILRTTSIAIYSVIISITLFTRLVL